MDWCVFLFFWNYLWFIYILCHVLQVVTKIIKHAREAPSSTAHGLLLGLDLDGVLEVSNSFPLPNQSHDTDEKSSKSIGTMEVLPNCDPGLIQVTARYQGSM